MRVKALFYLILPYRRILKKSLILRDSGVECKAMFEFDQKKTFSEREEAVLKWWQDREVFQKSLRRREGAPLFSVYDGPPFATGLPHYGHLLAGTIKDVIPRYKTMKGYRVPRRFGWDCHGLPIENEIEKAKELSGGAAIESFGIANFNEECRSIVLRYTGEWKKTVDRIGRWVDFDQVYRTMDASFMESVWWVFKEIYDKEMVYEGFKVMPFSAKLGTPLSNFEANLNYKEVDDPSLVVQFRSVDELNTFYLAWTTTPWTLPSNLALIVGPEVRYVKVKKGHQFFILAEERLKTYFPEEGEVVARYSGKELEKRRYVPLFPYFEKQSDSGAFQILLDDFVSVEDGTGIVHAAPGFGEVDFFVCKREGIDLVCPVDSNGRFTVDVPAYAGMLVKDADREIMRDLKKEGFVFYQGTVRHRYPFCWRSDTPLIYKAVKTWFVAVEGIRDRLVENNRKISWVPEHVQSGRFGNWLENARDWAISRNRYWGTPIPIWRNEKGECKVIGSVEELERLTKTKVNDLHRHHIDELTFEENGSLYRRIPEVFDCWFESGSMPYAQNHYPFENRELTEKGFPADFIAEGLDQTRGWFYTLHVLASALFDKPAFQNVIVNGIILAEDGNKMSKRLKNYPDPLDVINRYGADAVRLYMLHSAAVRADDLRFTEKGVEQVLRQILIPLWNSFVFFSTYAKIYSWKPSLLQGKPVALMDRWILSITQKLIGEIESALDAYRLNEALDPLVGFIDKLTNWYIRRTRSRFWADEETQDRNEAFQTLYTVLLSFVQAAAPFIPFCTESIFQELRTQEMPESIHLCDYPSVCPAWRDKELEMQVDAAQKAVRLGHSLRKEYKIKVRQPLSRAYLISSNQTLIASLEQQVDVIAEELNVKEIVFERDESAFVEWSAKPNFPVLGKKIGKKMQAAQKVISCLSREKMQVLFEGGQLDVEIDGEFMSLSSLDVHVERRVKEGVAAGVDGELALALDTELSEELMLEGLARELINKINTMRREKKFEVTDRIRVVLDASERIQAAFAVHRAFICAEVLALDVQFASTEGQAWDLNGERASISVERVPAVSS